MTTETSSNVESEIFTRPRIIIQPDWYLNLKSNPLSTVVWLEFKTGDRNSSNLHGKCSIKGLADSDIDAVCSEKFRATEIDRNQMRLKIKVDHNDLTHTFRAPLTSFNTSHQSNTNDETNGDLSRVEAQKVAASIHPHCLDISSGGIGLTALSNGTINIWDIDNGRRRRHFKGHIGDVYTSRFFPSDFALVSGGADMRVKLWSLDTENDRIHDTTLTGHYSRINDVLPLDSQRVLSASNDGSLILWDVQTSQSVEKLVQINQNSINSIQSIDSSIVAAGFQDGFVRFYPLNSKTSNQIINQFNTGASISALCYLSESKKIICANENSIIGVYDVRKLNENPIYAWKEQRGTINSIIPTRHRTGILVTSTDGSCFEYNHNHLQSMTNGSDLDVKDYTGADDSVLNVQVYRDKIYSICRDNIVRVYQSLE